MESLYNIMGTISEYTEDLVSFDDAAFSTLLNVEDQRSPSIITFEWTLDAVISDIKSKNIEFFLANETVKTRNVCIDGLSAVGKSSIGNLLKPSTKINMVGQNMHPSAAFGYFMYTLREMKMNQNNMWDRLPFNNYMWTGIWKVLSNCKITGSFNPSECVEYFKEIHPLAMEWLSSLAKNVIIVDSNEQLAALRLRSRNTGSDYERSFWPYYISVQNQFYKMLKEKYNTYYCLVDLADYGGNQTLMQQAVRVICNELFDDMNVADDDCLVFKPINNYMNKQILTDTECERERFRPILGVNFTDGVKRDY